MPGADDGEKDFWVGITAFGAILGTGLYALVEREWWFGAFYTLGGGGGLMWMSPAIRSRLGLEPSRVVVLAAVTVTWMFLSANIFVSIYDKWFVSSNPEEKTGNIAKQVQDKLDGEVKKNQDLTLQLDSLQRRLQGQSAMMQSLATGNLSALSNDDLKAAATKFIGELRKFEARYEPKQEQMLVQGQARMASIPQDSKSAQQEMWNKNISEQMATEAQHRSEYDVTYRSQTLRYKTEICKRLEFLDPCPANDPAILMIDNGDTGALFTVMIADYLTKIVEKLPPSQ
jgi:hypothetical protein